MIGKLDSLLYFVHVARCESFRSAAAKLHVTPSAVSQAIANLEATLAVRLFHRTTRQVRMTAEGQRLFDAVNGLFQDLENALEVLDDLGNEPQGTVRFTVPTMFGRKILLPLLAPFTRSHPRIKLEIVFDDGLADLIADGYDFSIAHGSAKGAEHVSLRLCELPAVLVASADYLRRHPAPERVEDLTHHHCIATRSSHSGMLPWTFIPKIGRGDDAPRTFSAAAFSQLTISGGSAAAIEAVLGGLGLAALCERYVEEELRSGRLQQVLPDYRLNWDREDQNTVYLHYPHRKLLAGRVRVLIEFIVRSVREAEALRRAPNAAVLSHANWSS